MVKYFSLMYRADASDSVQHSHRRVVMTMSAIQGKWQRRRRSSCQASLTAKGAVGLGLYSLEVQENGDRREGDEEEADESSDSGVAAHGAGGLAAQQARAIPACSGCAHEDCPQKGAGWGGDRGSLWFLGCWQGGGASPNAKLFTLSLSYGGLHSSRLNLAQTHHFNSSAPFWKMLTKCYHSHKSQRYTVLPISRRMCVSPVTELE
jgi:hypothetical protein